MAARALPPKAPPRPRPRHDRTSVRLDALGLLRCRRAVLKGIGNEVEVLGHVQALIESTTAQVFVDTASDEIRAATTMVRVASGQLVETSMNLAAHLGALKFLVDLDGITIEEPDIVASESKKKPR